MTLPSTAGGYGPGASAWRKGRLTKQSLPSRNCGALRGRYLLDFGGLFGQLKLATKSIDLLGVRGGNFGR
jgi:hypothetical protein